jgi:molecular chaperone GrpE (heat shock protein)
MKTFAATIIATVAAARGTAGGINQGYANPSFGATHGYGYNEGNGYLAGDSHGHTLDLRAHGAADSNAYDVKNYFEANTHIWGYDSVAKKHTTDSDLLPNTELLSDLEGALDAVQGERETKIQAELENRIYRLGLAFEAHQEKAEAPFIYQDDMLLQEIDDIKVAMSHAEDDQDDAFADLIERMTDFYNAKVLEFDSETDKIVRALDRAVRDSKDVGDVFYAMRIEWL